MSGKLFSGIKTDSIDLRLPIILRSSSTGALLTGKIYSDVVCYYNRQGTNPVQVTLSAGTSNTTSHSDGKFLEIDSVNMPGSYYIDFPDATFASGADWVLISVTGSGIEPFIVQYSLSPFLLDSSGRTTVITNDTGSITSGSFAASAINAAAIASNALTSAKFASGALANGVFGAGAIDAAALASNTITAAKIASAAITAAKFDVGAVDASALAASAATEIATAMMTTSIGTESYAADGSVPQLAQMLFMIWALLKGHNTAGTTLTAYKLDDTTTAMTFVFSPNGTNPTQITRTS